MTDSSVPIPLLFTCIAGPDQGKRFVLAQDEIVLGRATDCNVLSDDADVMPRHASIFLKSGKPACRALDSAPLFVDGQRVNDSLVEPGQQLRLGRSLWQIARTPEGETSWIGKLGEQITGFAGVEKIRGFSLQTMFSEVFKKRADAEVEDYLIVGTRTTTPPLNSVDANWPRPWLFLKAFSLSAAVYLLFYFGWDRFENSNLIPGLIMVGSFAIPFSILIFFFEVNVLRNVSLYEVIKLLLMGGVISLIVSLFAFDLTHFSRWLGPPAAGLIEECGKAAALLLVINKLRYRWILNGLLFGAAVGTGFAVFESAGYALRYGLEGGAQLMLRVITLRGLLSILGGHVLWTAMTGAALWRVRGAEKFSVEMFKDLRFLRVFSVAVLLHMVWDTSFEVPFYGKYIFLGFVAWVVLLGLVQQGLQQIKTEQAAEIAAAVFR